MRIVPTIVNVPSPALAGCIAASLIVVAASVLAADGVTDPQATEPDAAFETHSLRGKVVFLAPALEKRFGIKAVSEARERVLALETSAGTYHPLFEDVRGRSFRRDKRLRGIEVELLVRQYEGSPTIQVIQAFALERGRKYELDYWCEICAIAMFELKACDCCQGDIELRRRLVEPAGKNK